MPNCDGFVSLPPSPKVREQALPGNGWHRLFILNEMKGSLCGFDFLPERTSTQTEQFAENFKSRSFRGALRAEESLFLQHSHRERFLTSFGMTTKNLEQRNY